MSTKTVIRFKNHDCVVTIVEYVNNGRPAIELYHARDFDLVATATINIPEVPLADDEVIIKDYGENEGMLDALVSAGIVEDTGKRIRLAYIDVPVCRLLKGVSS